jgi:hypothetical protein
LVATEDFVAERNDEPQGEPREWWLYEYGGEWFVHRVGREVLTGVRVRRVNAAHDDWTAKLIELCELLEGNHQPTLLAIDLIRVHMKARPE